MLGGVLLRVAAAVPFAAPPQPAADLARDEAAPDAEPPVDEASAAAAPAAPATDAAPAPRPGERRLLRVYTDAAGFPCRDFLQPVQIDDARVQAIGTVCRGADGGWVLVREVAGAPESPAESAPPPPPQAVARHGYHERRGRMAREAFLASSIAIRLAGVRGQSGALHLLRSFDGEGGVQCREYEQTARLRHTKLRSRGTVCEEADGRWALVDGPLQAPGAGYPQSAQAR
jgi:surface antigen